MRTVAAIGCGFGDEGKGKIVSSLCQEMDNPLVVRYSGGQQAGHHVVLPGVDHVFSNFGSGTLQGYPTYWSKYCTVDPVGIVNELCVLKSKGISPILWVDWRCPVTTPYEKIKNIELEKTNDHGTCGVGFGQTLQREEDRYSLLFSDLFNRTVLDIKINLIREYYGFDAENMLDEFYDAVLDLWNNNYISGVDGKPIWDKDIIFEGSQGLLLDQDIGFFPHVTRSNVGSKNILEMGYEPEVYLVTRAYQTRHGNGPMTSWRTGCNIEENPHEQNFSDGHQGEFRIAPLSLDLLKYAISRDRYFKTAKINIVITCLDLIKEYCLAYDGILFRCSTVNEFIEKIGNILGIGSIYISVSPFTGKLEKYSKQTR